MKNILRFILSRFVWMAVIIFGVSIITFLLLHSIPGNPWQSRTGQSALANVSIDPISMRQLNRQFGLDKPLWQQYTIYMFGSSDENGTFVCGVICGNLGPSFRQRGAKVTDILFKVPNGISHWQSRFGYTARLAIFGFLFTALVGIPSGILIAFKKGTAFDRMMSGLITMLLATPNFILGILLVIVAASWLKLFKVIPVWDEPRDWVMPILVLAAVPTATLIRLTKTVMLEAMQGDYVRTARAKGASQARVIFRHVFPNASVPLITSLAPVLVELVAGSFIVEALFGFPGIGREYWLAITALDYPFIMGLTLIYSLGIVLVNIIVDALYGTLDPRLRTDWE
jgi:oligopeptide transport system permease protein